jgi:hypothetical protein
LTQIKRKSGNSINVVCFHLGNSPVSEGYMPTFRNTLFHLHRQVGVCRINVVITLQFVIFISGGYCNSSPQALLDAATPLDETVLGYETCFRFLLDLQPKICNKQSVWLYRVGRNCRLLCYGAGQAGLLVLKTTLRSARQPYTITIHCLNQKKLYLVQTTR